MLKDFVGHCQKQQINQSGRGLLTSGPCSCRAASVDVEPSVTSRPRTTCPCEKPHPATEVTAEGSEIVRHGWKGNCRNILSAEAGQPAVKHLEAPVGKKSHAPF